MESIVTLVVFVLMIIWGVVNHFRISVLEKKMKKKAWIGSIKDECLYKD